MTASTGNISTLAGNGTACPNPTTSCGDGGAAISAELNNPFGVAVDNSGNPYIGDSGDKRIRAVGSTSCTVSPPVIASMSPTSFYPGVTVTINGYGFNAKQVSGIAQMSP